jgi:hypothetical protein
MLAAVEGVGHPDHDRLGDRQPESRQVQTFTCGQDVEGAQPQTSDGDQLDVEKRTSDETVTRRPQGVIASPRRTSYFLTARLTFFSTLPVTSWTVPLAFWTDPFA